MDMDDITGFLLVTYLLINGESNYQKGCWNIRQDRGWWELQMVGEEYWNGRPSLRVSRYMGISIHGGTPIAGWFTMENPIKKLKN